MLAIPFKILSNSSIYFSVVSLNAAGSFICFNICWDEAHLTLKKYWVCPLSH